MYQTMMIPEFEQLTKNEKLAILDVREIDEFQTGHIKDAVNVPLSSFHEGLLPDFDKEQDYYVICHSGSRSQMFCDYMSSQGFKTTNIMGGMSAWRGEVV